MLDQAALPWFAELNRGLRDELDEETFRARIQTHTALLNSLAMQIVERACGEFPSLDAAEIKRILGDAEAKHPALLFARAA
jgi:hypothetical protein